MINEFEKMILLRECSSGAELKNIDGAIDEIIKGFQNMISSTNEFLIKGKNASLQLAEIIHAISILKSYGDQKGIEFPVIKTEKEAEIYMLKFGKQLIFC